VEIICFKCQMVTQWKLGKYALHSMARNCQHSDLDRNFAAKVLALILATRVPVLIYSTFIINRKSNKNNNNLIVISFNNGYWISGAAI
jgi:hypothetical protein